ncbi:MAG: hypothetical protein AAFX80_10570, partial [Cyanobacteria bacterium J06639_18]
ESLNLPVIDYIKYPLILLSFYIFMLHNTVLKNINKKINYTVITISLVLVINIFIPRIDWKTLIVFLFPGIFLLVIDILFKLISKSLKPAIKEILNIINKRKNKKIPQNIYEFIPRNIFELIILSLIPLIILAAHISSAFGDFYYYDLMLNKPTSLIKLKPSNSLRNQIENKDMIHIIYANNSHYLVEKQKPSSEHPKVYIIPEEEIEYIQIRK